MIRTLIVDDDALVRANLSSLLDWESCGYHIVHDCINGLQALDYLRLHDVDLLITDIKMPGIGGLQLLEQLRASARLPVSVVLSGYDEFELVRDAFRLGAYDYLLKANLNEHTLRRLLDDLRDKVFHEAAAPGTGRKEELSLPPGRYITAAFSVQNFAQVAQRYGGDLRERMQRPMLELARQIPRVSARAVIRAVDPSYYELYYQAADPFRAESGMDLAVRQICRVWKDMMNLEVSVGISGVIPHTQIPEAARQCGQLCRLAALRGPGAVCGSLRYGSLAHRCEQEAAACAGLVEAVCGGSGRDAQRQTSLWFVDLRRQEGEAHTARCAALLLGLEQKLQLSGQSLAAVLPERQDSRALRSGDGFFQRPGAVAPGHPAAGAVRLRRGIPPGGRPHGPGQGLYPGQPDQPGAHPQDGGRPCGLQRKVFQLPLCQRIRLYLHQLSERFADRAGQPAAASDGHEDL